MRGSFRKELKKFEKFKSGASSDEKYVPSLWYFDLLMFTRDQEMPTDSIDSLTTTPNLQAGEGNDIDDSSENFEMFQPIDDAFDQGRNDSSTTAEEDADPHCQTPSSVADPGSKPSN